MIPVYQGEPTERVGCWRKGGHKDPCSTCRLHHNPCTGCGNHKNVCEQLCCETECQDCGGGPLRYTGANVPAICCKAPLKDVILDQVKRDKYRFVKRKLIELQRSSVIINQGSPGRYLDCPYPEDTEAVAVNLRHVWSTRGWFSEDLKDYLRLPGGAKLILLSAMHDDVLERAWDRELYDADFKSIGFDYWQHLEFSQYDSMSNLNNIWQGYRTLRSIEYSKPHFCSCPPTNVLLSANIDRAWHRSGKAIPQAIINWQFTSLKRPGQFKNMLALCKKFVRRVPVKALWFLGVVSAEAAYNIKLALPAHRCYFMATNPWLAAHKGDEFTIEGKLKKSKLPKAELILQNQRNYANLIERAVSAAAQRTELLSTA